MVRSSYGISALAAAAATVSPPSASANGLNAKPIVTLEEARRLIVTSAFGMNANLDGWVTYKPSKLVPLAGQLTNLQQRSSATGDDSIQTVIDFRRSKDTLDP